MKIDVFNLQGNKVESVELPSQFSEEIRGDLINRAFHAYVSLFYQPKGSDPRAGLKTTAEYYGRRHAWRQTINTGRSRLPREKIPGGRMGRVLRVPLAVKGRRAHPPKPQKNIIEKINTKEKYKAIRSALAASVSKKEVEKKHIFKGILPLVLTDDFESLNKTKDVLKILTTIGLANDLQRASKGAKKTSGIKRLRGRSKRVPRSVLIVVGNDKGVVKAAQNILGVDAITVDKLNVNLLAPGGVPGRITLWTKSALQKLVDNALYY
ncbi:MAG: 50S ribosomal protein L4 [Candidatus Micrarchaeota archaeon]